MEEYFILMKEKDGIASSAAKKRFLISRGEILIKVNSEQHSPSYRVYLQPDVMVSSLRDDDINICPLKGSEIDYLLAVHPPSARMTEYMQTEKMRASMELKVGDTAQIKLPMTRKDVIVNGKIHYIGRISGNHGIHFGLEITDKKYHGKGTSDGSPHFSCDAKNGVFVSIDKIMSDPKGYAASAIVQELIHDAVYQRSPRSPVSRKRSATMPNISTTAGNRLQSPAKLAFIDAHLTEGRNYIYRRNDYVVFQSMKGALIEGTVKWTGHVRLFSAHPPMIVVEIEINELIDVHEEIGNKRIDVINQKMIYKRCSGTHTTVFLPAHLVSLKRHCTISISQNVKTKKAARWPLFKKRNIHKSISETSVTDDVNDVRNDREIHKLQRFIDVQNLEIASLEKDLETSVKLLSKAHGEIQIEENKASDGWKISHKDVKMTRQELGRGGWGVIWVGEFRGQKVAVKQMHKSIMSEYNLQLLHREINTMSQLRNPNLVQFIGAVLDDPSGQPLIITEIMDMSLRDAYEKKQLTPVPVHIPLAVMRDVAVGLNYLHCLPDPIIHRDVSSANVLLEPKGHGRWKTKISDFGSAKFARTAMTKARGAIIYSAPESLQSILDDEEDQPLTPKMDVFSYGVLLCEVLTCQFPDQQVFKAMLSQVCSQHHPYLHDLIQSCIKRNPQDRPKMDQVRERIDNTLTSLTE